MNRPTPLHVAILLPLVGVLGMMWNAQIRSATGSVWRMEIEGYDPRDPIHGQYLSYRLLLPLVAQDSGDGEAGASGDDPARDVLCFKRSSDGLAVLPILDDPAEREACDAWTLREALEGEQKFLVPEHRGTALETALRTHRGEVDVVIGRRGGTSVAGLFLDGEPWQAVLDRLEEQP